MEMHNRRNRIRKISDRIKIKKRNRIMGIRNMRSWLYNMKTDLFIVDKDFNQLTVMDTVF